MGEWRETVEAIRVLGLPKVIYLRLFYRRHMRLLHKRGRHAFRVRPLDGLLRCDWCGQMEDRNGVVRQRGIDTSKPFIVPDGLALDQHRSQPKIQNGE